MVTLLYHGQAIGYICKRIAKISNNTIQAVCDKDQLPDKIDGTLIRWDSAKELTADVTINTASAVRLSRNKKRSRIKLEGLCAPTWFSLADLRYPCLVRPKHHYAAHKFFVCVNAIAAKRAIFRCGYRRWYASPVIDKKLEYRIFVFQGYVVKVVRRFHNDSSQLAWNIANGGRSVRLKHESWPIESVKKAILAGERLGLAWYAADVIVDMDGQSHILECNTAPGLQRDATINMLSNVFVSNERLNEEIGHTWKTLLHPALR